MMGCRKSLLKRRGLQCWSMVIFRAKNIQGLEEIKQQLQSLRRENHFLKVGLIFCLVLSALPYLTGFQPTVIRASKVVTKRIEFVRDGKTVISISLPKAMDWSLGVEMNCL